MSASAVQDSIIKAARACGQTEAAAQTREERARRIEVEHSCRERAHREAIDAVLRVAPDAAYRLAAVLSGLPPWCPACGEYMTHEKAQPADPTTNSPAIAACWTCCGVVIACDTMPPTDPHDERTGN
jgi:hypothetical protein